MKYPAGRLLLFVIARGLFIFALYLYGHDDGLWFLAILHSRQVFSITAELGH